MGEFPFAFEWAKFLRQYQKMFSKKCMVVGSLLVMAAQTATAASTCSGMAGDVDTICGQNGYAGVLVDNAGAVDCAGDTCNNNDAITCCKPAALCTTITDVSDPFALSEVCSDNAVYANAVTVGAFCAGTACALSDESRCCVVKANCDTITLGTSPSLTEVCGGDDAFTGALIGSASSTKCAGAACGTVDNRRVAPKKLRAAQSPPTPLLIWLRSVVMILGTRVHSDHLLPSASVPRVVSVIKGRVAPLHLLVPLTMIRVTTWLPVVPVLQEELPSSLHAIRVTQPRTMVT